MKKDTTTITRAEYAYLNKAANVAVEHACELFKAARLVDELQARIAELEAERDALKEEVERCEAAIRFWKKGACDLLQELEER